MEQQAKRVRTAAASLPTPMGELAATCWGCCSAEHQVSSAETLATEPTAVVFNSLACSHFHTMPESPQPPATVFYSHPFYPGWNYNPPHTETAVTFLRLRTYTV